MNVSYPARSMNVRVCVAPLDCGHLRWRRKNKEETEEENEVLVAVRGFVPEQCAVRGSRVLRCLRAELLQKSVARRRFVALAPGVRVCRVCVRARWCPSQPCVLSPKWLI